MSRSISISTDVYAALWSSRQAGEETEDQILRRLLNCPKEDIPDQLEEYNALARIGRGLISGIGFYDSRHNVKFPEGFVIFRTYKNEQYSAHAIGNKWVRNDNKMEFTSLNQLNQSIVDGAENVWNNSWKFQDSNGAIHYIESLRK